MEAKYIKHLEWIYSRMVYVHHENEHYDYMIKFKSIIDEAKIGVTIDLSLKQHLEEWLRKNQ